MRRRVPIDLPYETDISDAAWISETLEPWKRPVRLASFMPDGFEAYVRVLHPFVVSDHSGVRFTTWTEMAARRSVRLSSISSAHEICGLEDLYGEPLPEEGRLPEWVCGPLVHVLRAHTHRPESCWFGIWHGWGDHQAGVMLAEGRPPLGVRLRERAADRRSRRAYASVPRVRGQGRDYVVLRRSIGAACSLEVSRGRFVPPSIWWDDDRAWVVVTEIEGHSTYVGGSRELANSLLAAEELETLAVTRDAPIG